LTKSPRERGAVPSLSYILIDYKIGDRVHIVINPSIHSSMPHRRYHGKTGVISGKRDDAYEVKVTLGNKVKTIYVRPEHLRPTPEVWERVVRETRELIQGIKFKISEVRRIISKTLAPAA